MCAHFVPDSVDIGNFILKEQFIAKTFHDVVDFSITCCNKDAASLLDFVFALAEVVIELVNELVRLINSSDMPLTSAISLLLDHDTTLL